MDSLTCYSAIRRALSLGYRHIDTAMAYDNEAAVGRALEISPIDREDIFLTTKVKGYPRYLSHDAFRAAAQGCAERLGVDTIDLLLVHWWHPQGDMEGTCAALDSLVEDGLVDHIGVSNFSVEQMQEATGYLDTPILTNQIEYHAYRPQDDILAYCRDNDILLTAYSPLAEGRLISDELLERIGSRYGKTAAQVAIRWLIQQESVVTIPKATSIEHQRANLQVFDFDLTAEEVDQIAAHRGPLLYRLTTDGGLIQRARHRAGKIVPEAVRQTIGTA